MGDNLNKLYGSSCRGYVLFKYMGHPNVSVLKGGYQGIIKLDETKQKQIKTVMCNEKNKTCDDVEFEYNDHWMAGRQNVLDVVLGRKKAHLLDVRDVEEWNGLSSSPYGTDFCPRKGRLPNAKWMEWYEFMSNEGEIRSKEEVEAMMI